MDHNRRDSQLILPGSRRAVGVGTDKRQHAETPNAPPLLCCSDSDGEVAFSMLFHLKTLADPDSGSPI